MIAGSDFDDFARAYDSGRAVRRRDDAGRRSGDAGLRLSEARRAAATGNMFLLESVEGGAQRGRYSMIGLDPDVIWRVERRAAEINRARARRRRRRSRPARASRWRRLRALLAESRIDLPRRPAADGGGRVRLSRLRHGAPDGAAGARQARSDRRAGRGADPPDDHGRVRQRARRDVRGDAGAPARGRVAARRARGGAGAARGDRRRRWRRRSTTPPPASIRRCSPRRSRLEHAAEAEFLAMVARAKDYIVAGDIFQVVLSQRFTSRFDLPAFSLYRALRRVNPSPYLVLSRFRRLPDRRARARKFWCACATAR